MHLVIIEVKVQRNELVDEVIAEEVEDGSIASNVLDQDGQRLQHLYSR